jgi:translation initiation factor 1
MCPECNRPAAHCECRGKKAGASRGSGDVRVGRETKGRKGKGVTIITGLPLDSDELRQLGRDLKQKCGTGGTVKQGRIEIQGDHRDRLVTELRNRGFTAKRSGG